MNRIVYIALMCSGIAGLVACSPEPVFGQDQQLTPVLVDSSGVIVKPNATVLALANNLARADEAVDSEDSTYTNVVALAQSALQPNAASSTNIIITADGKTNTIIVIDGQISSWVVTE